MSNQAFLVCSRQRTIYPSYRESGFSAKQQIIAVGDWCIPLLWLAIFDSEDIKTCVIKRGRSRLRASAPITHKRFVARRLSTSVSTLEKTFPKVRTWQRHADLLRSGIEMATAKRPYLSIQWDQIAAIQSSDDFSKSVQWLMRFLSGQRVQSPAKKLGQLTGVDWSRSFPDPVASELSDADELNLARLLGSDYERPVPWWPSATKTKQAKKRTAAKRTSAKRTSAKSTGDTDQDIKQALSSAIEKHAEPRVRTILKRVKSLADSSYGVLLDQAIRSQSEKRRSPNQIPSMLIRKGIPISQEALTTVATKDGTYAQFKAMLDSGRVDPGRPAKTFKARVSAPPLFWAVCGEHEDREEGVVAVKKVKRLLEENVPVDVANSSRYKLLFACVTAPRCAKLLIPLASESHRRAALRHAMSFRFSPLSKRAEVDELAKCLLHFLRELEKSGLQEAAGKNKVIQKRRDEWVRVKLPRYPYGR